MFVPPTTIGVEAKRSSGIAVRVLLTRVMFGDG